MKILKAAIFQAIAILALALIAGFAFNSFSRNGIDPFKEREEVPVASDSAAADGGMRFITVEEARAVVESGVPVIDARRKEDYDEGHIPGAILFDYYDMASYRDQVLPLLSPDQMIMVYCSEPTCEDSELLAKELYLLGYKKLLVFKGGYEEWNAAGFPVERGAP